MKSFSVKHPLLFGAILFFVSILFAAVLSGVCSAMYLPIELGTSVGRVVVALVLIVLFRECFSWGKSFSGIAYALPVLLVVAWNVFYHLASGSELVTSSALLGSVILGFAPGIFEEVLFRGVVIDRLRKGGKDDWYTLWASAILFAVVHLTNAVGADLVSVLVQVGYSLVIGLLFGAIYLRTDDIATVILGHAAIDISNQVFATQPTTTSVPMIAVFAIVLVVLLVCSLRIAPKSER